MPSDCGTVVIIIFAGAVFATFAATWAILGLRYALMLPFTILLGILLFWYLIIPTLLSFQ